MIGGRRGRPAPARYKHFADFGATPNGKLSGRVPLSDRIAVRGGLDTGFRAPTPASRTPRGRSRQQVVQRRCGPGTEPTGAVSCDICALFGPSNTRGNNQQLNI